MIFRKIVKFTEPHKQDRSFHGGLHEVEYEGIPNTRAVMFRAEFLLASNIDKLIRQGMDVKDIKSLVELTIHYCFDEISLDGEGE